MKVGRHEPELRTALAMPIQARRGNRNMVMRVGAFPKVQAEKAALGRCYSCRVWSGQSNSRKEPRPLPRGGNRGGDTRPSQSLAVWQCGYTSFSATKLRTTRKGSVGAKIDRLKRCSVNMVECDSRLTRLHAKLGVALTGGEIVRMTSRQAVARIDAPRCQFNRWAA